MSIIPILAYVAALLAIMAWRPEWGFRRVLLRTAVLAATYALLITELLGLGSLVTPGWLAAAWILATLVAGAILSALLIRGHRLSWPRPSGQLSRPEIILWIGLGIILSITALVAWVAPPQTWDALNYHMPRVAHWAQAASLKHFPTGIEVQNSRTAAAEILMLQPYVLAQGDRWVNFVQWFAMLGGLVGSSLIAGQLGAKRLGQLAAAVFTATLPIGIIQASGAMTDYVAALWVVVVASETLELRQERFFRSGPIFLALSAGLGLATKPTTVTALLPFGVYAGYLLYRQNGLARTVAWGSVAAGIALILNGGQLLRNVNTYGSALNPAQVAVHANELRNPRGVISNVLRHAGLQAGTPSPHVNKVLAIGVQEIHKLIGLDVNDPRMTAHGAFKIATPTTNEDRAGNPLQAYALVGLVAFAARKRPAGLSTVLAYGFALAASVLVLSYLFKWQIFATRYHLMFFVLAAPIAGLFMERLLSSRWVILLLVLMVLASVPWLLQIKSRPLVPVPGESYVGSIFTESRAVLYLANGTNLIEPYMEITNRILRADCNQVGLLLSGNAAEYPLWAYLQAPDKNLEIEWIVSGTPSEQYADPDFSPCAVICEGCPADWTEIRSLPLDYEVGQLQLYLDRNADSN